MTVSDSPLNYDSYTVGWIATLPSEVDATRLVLDHEHPSLPKVDRDNGTYILGDVEGHNVVISYPAAGQRGTAAASRAATNMMRTFTEIKFILMVGVASAAPAAPDVEDPLNDIRLGDVVVGCPGYGKEGVIQYNYGRLYGESELVIRSGHLSNVPDILIGAVNAQGTSHRFAGEQIMNYIRASEEAAGRTGLRGHSFPGWEKDELFHSGQAMPRLARESDVPAIHYGLVGSGDSIIRSSEYRDKMRAEHGILCFDTGAAAGTTVSYPGLAIRGISDYADEHADGVWERYAATTAAAYAKDLLRVLD